MTLFGSKSTLPVRLSSIIPVCSTATVSGRVAFIAGVRIIMSPEALGCSSMGALLSEQLALMVAITISNAISIYFIVIPFFRNEYKNCLEKLDANGAFERYLIFCELIECSVVPCNGGGCYVFRSKQIEKTNTPCLVVVLRSMSYF